MTSGPNSRTSWREIPDDADALGLGEVFRFEIHESETVSHFYSLTKQGGDLAGDDDWSWVEVAVAARALKLGETLTFRTTNDMPQTDDGEDPPSACVVFRLTLRATFESE